MSGLVIQGSTPYEIGPLVGETNTYRVYKVTPLSDVSHKKNFLLKVVTETTHNGLLDREALMLTIMREEAISLEKQFVKKYPEKRLNYHLGFPSVVETFLLDESQGNRRALVIEIEGVDQVETLVPLSMITKRDRVRVDPKTSAWIIGKSLKIMAFAHDLHIAPGMISGDSILINREKHLVVFFDWSQAIDFSQEKVFPRDYIISGLHYIAKESFAVLGGDINTSTIPDSEQLTDARYQEFLARLAEGGFSSASEAHHEFYTLIESMWGRTFHPYTTTPL
jgi:serine/threonine protein kinase